MQSKHRKALGIALAALIIAGFGAGLAVGYSKGELTKSGIMRNVHRLLDFRRASSSVAHATLAGLASADLTADGLELSGWAPPEAAIQILDRGQPVALAVAEADGRWSTAYAADRERRDLEALAITFQEKDKATAPMGRLMLFLPDSAPDDAYIWWWGSDSSLQLLAAPDSADENDLALTLAFAREGQAPVFAGRAVPDSIVQIYASDQLAGAAIADPKGFWVVHPLMGAEKKADPLRFDEIRKIGRVAERRSYRLSWPDAKDSTDETPQRVNESWIVPISGDGGRVFVYILKPESGTALSADDEIPGEIMPLSPSDAAR